MIWSDFYLFLQSSPSLYTVYQQPDMLKTNLNDLKKNIYFLYYYDMHINNLARVKLVAPENIFTKSVIFSVLPKHFHLLLQIWDPYC